VIVRVLGSAAGGGVPQWNCACANCEAARAGRAPHRTQSSLALCTRDGRWLLLNCSPDVAAQIEAFAPLQPGPDRTTPIDGILLTDANLDHIGGLASLRQARSPMRVWSSAIVREIAAKQPSFAQFAAPPHRWLEMPLDAPCGNDFIEESLLVRAFAVPGATPAYDGRRAQRGAVVAFEIVDGTSGSRLLFAPVFGAIDDALGAAIARASVAFLDGSFYSDDELEDRRFAGKPARALGHQPVGGPGGTLARLRGTVTRVIFTHINNSNPMLDPQSEAYASVRAFGAEVAYDGMELTV
jgi:pyrroloquinoline quinone biosynthesis protein B